MRIHGNPLQVKPVLPTEQHSREIANQLAGMFSGSVGGGYIAVTGARKRQRLASSFIINYTSSLSSSSVVKISWSLRKGRDLRLGAEIVGPSQP